MCDSTSQTLGRISGSIIKTMFVRLIDVTTATKAKISRGAPQQPQPVQAHKEQFKKIFVVFYQYNHELLFSTLLFSVFSYCGSLGLKADDLSYFQIFCIRYFLPCLVTVISIIIVYRFYLVCFPRFVFQRNELFGH